LLQLLQLLQFLVDLLVYAKHTGLPHHIQLLRQFTWSWSRALKLSVVVIVVAVLSFLGTGLLFLGRNDGIIQNIISKRVLYYHI
jgi:hypothetical protein